MVRNAERVALYAGLTLAIALGLSANSGTRAVAQNSGAAPTANRIATADVLTVAERIIQGADYRLGRDDLVETLNKPLKEMRDQLQAMQVRYQGLAPNSPERETLQKEFQSLQATYQERDRAAVDQVEKFNTRQVARAYSLVIDAAEKMGTDLGYTHVIATRAGKAEIRSENVPGAVQEMLARPIIKGVPADDLTDRLFKQFKVEAAVATPEPPPPAPASAPTTPATAPKKP